MALIDELREKLKDVETYIAARHAQIRVHGSALEELERQRWDLDIAIAALEPPAAVTEPEPTDPEPQDDASEFAEEGYAPVTQDEREQPVTDVAALIASGEHSYDEVAAIAYPEPQWNEPEGYTPATSPEADSIAKALDHYDPKAMADRDRFNPFGMFRKEGDQ